MESPKEQQGEIKKKKKKDFLNEQCKEIEENDRIVKTTDLFKRLRENKRTFHAKMNTIKDSNGIGLTEAEEQTAIIHRNYTKKILMTQMTTMV